MKIIFIFVFAFFIMASSCKAQCNDEGNGNIPIVTFDNSTETVPHRAPIHAQIYGVFNKTTATLSLHANSGTPIKSIHIYKDENIIIADTMIFNANDVFVYNLSLNGIGHYEVNVVMEDGVIYTGNF